MYTSRLASATAGLDATHVWMLSGMLCVVLPKVWLLYKWLTGAPAVKVVAGAVVRMFLATQHAFLRVASHRYGLLRKTILIP